MNPEEIQQRIIEVFESSKDSSEALSGIYSLFIPNWEDVEYVELHPMCGMELHRFIKDNFIEFEEKKCPDFPPGALWFYKGFFPYRKMEPWKVDVSTGIITYKKK